jgi:hypothetical protein
VSEPSTSTSANLVKFFLSALMMIMFLFN